MMQPKNPFLLTAFSECSTAVSVLVLRREIGERGGRADKESIHHTSADTCGKGVEKHRLTAALRKSYLAKGESEERAV